MRKTKNIPPAKDRTIPTGISYGLNATRQKRSHKSTKEAPKIALNGIKKICLFPIKTRTICGTTSPINPRRPAKLTTHPAALPPHRAPPKRC